MGSLSSRPKIPQVQQPLIITVPAQTPAPAAPPTPVTDTTTVTADEGSSSDSAGSDSVRQAQAREDHLLSRSRGRLSTVLTGFRGVLSQPVTPSPRKSLLGE